MQDFTKMVTTAEIKPLSQVSSDKVHEKWLNKDRIWNLVFWFGMSAGLAFGNFFRYELRISQLGFWCDLSTIVCLPLVLIIFNRTRFVTKDTLANSEEKELIIKHMPYSFPLAIMTGVGTTFIVSETILSKQYGNIYEAFIFWFCMFSGISVYFIFKNCPIAILFNYKFWTFDAYLGREGAGSSCSSSSNNAYYERMRDSSNYMNKISNPAYSYRPDNIWHNR